MKFNFGRREKIRPSGEPRIDVLEHVPDFVLISEEKHTSVFAWYTLHLRHYSINDCSLVGIGLITHVTRSRVKHVRFINDQDLPSSSR